MTVPPPTCEACNQRPGIGVAAVPGCPVSVSYCRECLDANAHPYWVLVANTACVGRYDDCADWWREMVDDTLRYLGKSREDFDAEVKASVDQMNEEMARLEPLFEDTEPS